LVEIVGCVLIWTSASAREATPLVVVGGSEHGVIVLSGSGASYDGTTGVRVDSVQRGIDEPLVVLDTTRRNTLLGGGPSSRARRARAARRERVSRDRVARSRDRSDDAAPV
jgi:hypothetical protein